MPGNGRERDLADYCLRLGDDRLVLGHRLSEWCGHLPILEEELSLGNVALDLLEQAEILLGRAGEIDGRSGDDLAFFRESVEFRNCLLVEQPNGDFAATIARQLLFDAFDAHSMAALEASADGRLGELARRAAPQAAYHLRHSREWTVRLGDGTEESHRRMQAAFDDLWTFTGELFEVDESLGPLVEAKIAVDPERLREPWRADVLGALGEAGLTAPADEQWIRSGGRRGLHGEGLGRMLFEMQSVARAHPGARW